MLNLRERISKSSMRSRIVSFTIFSVVFCSCLLIVIVSRMAKEALLDQIGGNLQAISSAKATEVDQSFRKFSADIRNLTNSKFIQDALVSYESVAYGTGLDLDTDSDISSSTYFKSIEAKYSENFSDFLKSYPITSFSLTLNNGFAISQVGSSHLLGKNILKGSLKSEAVSQCLSKALKSGSHYSGMQNEQGTYKSYFCQNIKSKYDRDGYKQDASMGVLIAEMDWSYFAKLKDFHEGLGESGELFLVENGSVFTPPRKYSQLTATDLLKTKLNFQHPDTLTMESSTNFASEDSFVIVRSFEVQPNTKWTLVAQIGQGEALAPITKLNQWSFSILALTLVLISLTSWFVISSIAKGFEVAAESVHNTSLTVGQSSEQFGEITSVVSVGVQQQSAALVETSSTMEEMNSMVQKTLELSKRSSEKASKCSLSATEGEHKMASLVEAVNAMGQTTSKAFDSVKVNSEGSLGSVLNSFKEVESKTKVINEIAFQTKLLSFNASIEAARAGEHGRGFSVVAEEVGNLANLVTSSASEINQLINETTTRIGSLLAESRSLIQKSTEATQVQILSSQHEAKEGLSFFKDLSQKIQEINVEVLEVTSAAETQSQGIDEINRAILQISESNGKTSSMIEKLEAETHSLKDSVGDLTSANNSMEVILFGASGKLNHQQVDQPGASLKEDSLNFDRSPSSNHKPSQKIPA